MSKTVDRDQFLNELNERLIGLTVAQSVMASVLAEISDDFARSVEERFMQAIENIPEEMRTSVVMAQLEYLLTSVGRGAQKKGTGMPPYLRVIRGGKGD